MGHYYAEGGVPCYFVPTKSKTAKADTRSTTVKDAKANGWVPSVSEIMNVMAAQSLVDWKVNNAIDFSYLEATENPITDATDFKNAVRKRIDKSSDQITGTGSEWHAYVEAFVKGEYIPEEGAMVVDRFKRAMDNQFREWIPVTTEYPFANFKHGYGGRIDLVIYQPVEKTLFFCDLKTKNSKAKITPMDKNAMQLVAYSNGVDLALKNRSVEGVWVHPEADRMIAETVEIKHANIYMKVHEEDELIHVWSYEDCAIQWRIFRALLEVWRLDNEYDPRRK